MLFIVDEADVPVDYGSVTAAPYARQILEQSLMYMGVAPDTAKQPETVRVPDVTDLPVTEAKRMLRETSLSVTQIADRLSFDCPNYFSKVFKKITGYTPLQYKKTRRGRS